MNVEKCCVVKNCSRIKVQEHGKSATLKNDARLDYVVVDVDKCLQLDGPRADFLIEHSGSAVAIELKGRGVEHGATQVTATCQLWLQLGRANTFGALIVGAMSPRARPSMQVRRSKSQKLFNGPLHVVNANNEFEFPHLLSFKGPFKA